MPILDALVPGRARTKARKAILDLTTLAHEETKRQSLPPARAMLWNAI